MKSKLLTVLTVCLVILALFAPSFAILGWFWQQHIELVTIQRLAAYEAKQSSLISSQQQITTNVLLGLSIFSPLGLCLGISLQEKYQAYRATVLKQKIISLENIWQQNIQN